MIDSQSFYKTLKTLTSEVEAAIHKSGYDNPIGITIYMGQYWQRDGEIELRLSAGSSSNAEVKGRDIWAMTDEFLRRVGFERQQSLLQLGAPQIDEDGPKDDPNAR